MSRKKIIVIGSNFAGFTVAVNLKEALGHRHDVVVISKLEEFVFVPSLVWIPFGLRTHEEVTFPLRGPLETRGVEFIHEEVARLDLEQRLVSTKSRDHSYDYLVIATGPKPNYGAVPGLGPRYYTHSIMSLAEAHLARAGFEKFLAAPGPVVVGTVQGAPRIAATYEFLFNMAHQLKRHGIENVPLTYLSGEVGPARSILGNAESLSVLTEPFLQELDIQTISGAFIQSVKPGAIQLSDGREVPFAFAMLIPPLLGVDFVRACDRITNASGFIQVNEYCQTHAYPEVFAAGVAVASQSDDVASARTSQQAERMAKIVAKNIIACVEQNATGKPLPATTRELTEVPF